GMLVGAYMIFSLVPSSLLDVRVRGEKWSPTEGGKSPAQLWPCVPSWGSRARPESTGAGGMPVPQPHS
uniref:Uncharacterized protein n=1 Tax=Suricata suricatta TaxID=37032 RepID=A0A673TQS5_SURSU